MTKRYTFEIELWGEGATAEEAWNKAVEAFSVEDNYFDPADITAVETFDAEDHCIGFWIKGSGENAMPYWEEGLDEPDHTTEADAGDDLCDRCYRSGVQVSMVDDHGLTMCDECAAHYQQELDEEDN